MAVAYITDDALVIYVMRGEIAPKRGAGFKKNSYWALTALLVLSDDETDQPPVTRWWLTPNMKPAVERILNAKKAQLEYLTKDECEARVLDVLSGDANQLNIAVDSCVQLT